MDNFQDDKLLISVDISDSQVTLAWQGKSEAAYPGVKLNPWLDEALQAAQGRDVELDFRRLEYINSNTIPSILHFLKRAIREDNSVRLVYNKDVAWQKTVVKGLSNAQNHRNFSTIPG